MNSLNPNIKQALLSSTDFKESQIKLAFDYLKMIETDSSKAFVLTDEKFILFVERCHKKKWQCDTVGSKLAARIKLLYTNSGWEGGVNFGTTDSFEFDMEYINKHLKDWKM